MPQVKDRFGNKIKTNVITNEVKEVKAWIKDKQISEGKRYEFIPRDVLFTTLHRKGQWINPNKISILNKPKAKLEYDMDWQNREQLCAIDQQRVILERLMVQPNQEIRMRTQKHAIRDTKLYTPRVFRNEGGNLMSSIAGAGCNKFHEFRQIRRNDRDREKFFKYMREKEERDGKVKAHYTQLQDENMRKLARNQRKRARVNANFMGKKKMSRLSSRNKIVNLEMHIRDRANSGDSSGSKTSGQKTLQSLKEEEEAEAEEDKYDPDDSYDEDEDDGLPPIELRMKAKKDN